MRSTDALSSNGKLNAGNRTVPRATKEKHEGGDFDFFGRNPAQAKLGCTHPSSRGRFGPSSLSLRLIL
jgi:hypothetical protein